MTLFESATARLLKLSPLGRFALLLVGCALLRSASLAYAVMDIDEAHWTLIGKILLGGGRPYVDFVDHKPPLLFYLYAGLVWLARGNLAGIHVLMILWIVATASLLGASARRLTGSSRAALFTAVAYVLLSSSNVLTANSELLANLPLAAALHAMARALTGRRIHLAGTGALIGVAVLVRLQSGIALVAVATSLALMRFRRERTRLLADAALLAVGFGAVIAATAAAFAATGNLARLWEWSIARNMAYPPPRLWMKPALLGVGLYLVAAQAWAWVLAGRPIATAVRAVRRTGSTELPRWIAVAVPMLILSALAVTVGRRFYSHYFLQIALPLALVVGVRASDLSGATPRARGWRLLMVLGVLCAIFFAAMGWGRGALGRYPGQDEKVIAVTRYLNRPDTPRGRILLWGDSSQIYYGSDRLPGSRFYNVAPLVGNFDTNHVPDGFRFEPYLSHRDIATYLEDVRRLQPPLVVDTSTAPIHFWHRFPMRKVAPVYSFIQRHYRPLARVAGVQIYRRLARAEAADTTPNAAPPPR